MSATRALEGLVAVVTGASGGLGGHFARLLARQGARVALAARRVDRLTSLAGEISSAGGEAFPIALDVSQVEAIDPAFGMIEQQLGPIAVLVNNAGVSGEGLALELAAETWDQAFAVNVRAAVFAAQAAARRMLASGVAEQGQGRIVNIASIGAHKVLPGLVAYCASKAALVMATKVLARDWARHGIAVNALCPGYIETDLNADWFASDGGQRQLKGFPRRRLMEAADLDAAFAMLTGPTARAITGSAITIDDGQSL
jgi:NAD(P)-dependent dehydrogenase (short-subunit alcohol dehydrogenase family)